MKAGWEAGGKAKWAFWVDTQALPPWPAGFAGPCPVLTDPSLWGLPRQAQAGCVCTLQMDFRSSSLLLVTESAPRSNSQQVRPCCREDKERIVWHLGGGRKGQWGAVRLASQPCFPPSHELGSSVDLSGSTEGNFCSLSLFSIHTPVRLCPPVGS